MEDEEPKEAQEVTEAKEVNEASETKEAKETLGSQGSQRNLRKPRKPGRSAFPKTRPQTSKMLSCFVCRHAHLTLTEDTHTDDAHIFLKTLKGPSYEGEPDQRHTIAFFLYLMIYGSPWHRLA
jgi:hypothetical protein